LSGKEESGGSNLSRGVDFFPRKWVFQSQVDGLDYTHKLKF
jgi:hypothetical protein